MEQVPARRTVVPIFLLSLFLALGAGAQEASFVEKARFIPADLQLYDSFGQTVALSGDGDTALVPAAFQGCGASLDCGAVYVFARGESGWVQEAKLRPAEIAAGDHFGLEAVLSENGDLALVSASARDCAAGKDCGAAYFFERDEGVWSEGQKLTAPEAESFAYFGGSLALSGSGSVAFVGSILEDCSGGVDCGVLHIYRRAGGLFVHEAKLTPPNDVSNSSNAFGTQIVVSRDGETLLCHGDFYGGFGGGGSIYVFRYSGGTWVPEPKITPSAPSDLKIFSAAALSGDGQTLLIKETSFDGDWNSSVKAWGRVGANWVPQSGLAVLSLTDVVSGTLSFDGNTAVVGGGPTNSARVFHRAGGVWTPGQALATPELAATRNFVALSDDARTLLLSALSINCMGGDCPPAAFIFEQDAFSPDIPTASEVGLAVLALLLAGVGAARLRRA